MEVGGVERSLISLLENFNYKKFNVDLMLYRHCGDFMKLLPNKHNLLSEVDEYASFRKSIIDAGFINSAKYSSKTIAHQYIE